MTGFSQAARSIRAAVVYAILALLVCTTIEIGSSSKDDSGKKIPEKASAKRPNSKKTTKQPEEPSMKTVNKLSMRIKVGGTRIVLALAGVRRQS